MESTGASKEGRELKDHRLDGLFNDLGNSPSRMQINIQMGGSAKPGPTDHGGLAEPSRSFTAQTCPIEEGKSADDHPNTQDDGNDWKHVYGKGEHSFLLSL